MLKQECLRQHPRSDQTGRAREGKAISGALAMNWPEFGRWFHEQSLACNRAGQATVATGNAIPAEERIKKLRRDIANLDGLSVAWTMPVERVTSEGVELQISNLQTTEGERKKAEASPPCNLSTSAAL